ncbi:MAG TPA: flavodoxin family protein [Bacillota bacterium]|jgi:multimeric flavodoxin WrbA
MKVVGISGSLRKEGNTEYLVRFALDQLKEQGFETELISLRGKTVQPCDGCYGCVKANRCVIEGDDFEPIADKMYEADGIILGSPVYYSSVVPQLMALLDRVGFSSRWSGKFMSGKVGGPITVARRTGHNLAFAQLLMWFYINDMIVPGSSYWSMSVAGTRGARDADKDQEGLDTIKHFCENMAHVMKKLHA